MPTSIQKVNGISNSVQNTIVKDIASTNAKINSLEGQLVGAIGGGGNTAAIKADIEKLEKINAGFLKQLIENADFQINQIENDPSVDAVIAGLNKKAKEAKKTSNRLKNLAEEVETFAAALAEVVAIVVKLKSLI